MLEIQNSNKSLTLRQYLGVFTLHKSLSSENMKSLTLSQSTSLGALERLNLQLKSELKKTTTNNEKFHQLKDNIETLNQIYAKKKRTIEQPSETILALNKNSKISPKQSSIIKKMKKAPKRKFNDLNELIKIDIEEKNPSTSEIHKGNFNYNSKDQINHKVEEVKKDRKKREQPKGIKNQAFFQMAKSRSIEETQSPKIPKLKKTINFQEDNQWKVASSQGRNQ